MRVILHIDSGPASGRKVLLRNGQRLSVGRSSLNDFSIADDDQMSATHFEIITNSTTCCVVDANSSNGTQVNGAPIDRIVLRNNDQVMAGSTCFHVDIDGGDDSFASEERVGTPAIAQCQAVKTEKPEDVWEDVSVESLGTNLTCCRGHSPIAMVAEQLSANSSFYLSVDFRKLGQEIPNELKTKEFLFDWLPAEAAAANSPILFPAAAAPNWHQIVESGARKDAVVMFFTSLAFDDLVQHLQIQLRAGSADAEQILGICWPSVLGTQLTIGEAQVAQRIMTDIEYILIEQSDDSAAWQLFGHANADQVQDQQCYEEIS